MAIKKPPLAGQVKTPPAERIATSVRELTAASAELNSASEQLNKMIDSFESHLKRIKPPIATWHEISAGDQYSHYWHRDIGYAKVGVEWGIALREVEGNYNDPDGDAVEVWPFKDAPQWMQIESVGKLPDLLETMIKRTQETTKKLRAKTEEARELAEALAKAVEIESLI